MTILTNKSLSLLIVSLLVTACGGGGGGGGVENSAGNTKATVTMQELVAADDFLFTTKQSIQVSVSLAEYKIERAYISIYSDYQQLPSGRYYPNASSRTIAGNLQQGEFENSFFSLGKQSTFLVEVWLYDGQDPLQKELTLVNNKLVW